MNVVIKLLHDGQKKFDEKASKFSDKIRICDMYGIFVDHSVYQQINLVNKLRNGIAHNLEYNPVELEKLFKFNAKTLSTLTDNIQDEHLKMLGKLNLCMTGICGSILGVADVKIQCNNYSFRNLPTDASGDFDYVAMGFVDPWKPYIDHYGLTVDKNGQILSIKNPAAKVTGLRFEARPEAYGKNDGTNDVEPESDGQEFGGTETN
jgi:hypothetical protein